MEMVHWFIDRFKCILYLFWWWGCGRAFVSGQSETLWGRWLFLQPTCPGSFPGTSPHRTQPIRTTEIFKTLPWEFYSNVDGEMVLGPHSVDQNAIFHFKRGALQGTYRSCIVFYCKLESLRFRLLEKLGRYVLGKFFWKITNKKNVNHL